MRDFDRMFLNFKDFKDSIFFSTLTTQIGLVCKWVPGNGIVMRVLDRISLRDSQIRFDVLGIQNETTLQMEQLEEYWNTEKICLQISNPIQIVVSNFLSFLTYFVEWLSKKLCKIINQNANVFTPGYSNTI